MVEPANTPGNSARLWLARLLWITGMVGVVATIILLILNQANPLPRAWAVAGGGVYLGFTFSTVGLLIITRHHQHLIGWLLLAIGMGFVLYEGSSEYAVYALHVAPGALPGGVFAAWLGAWIWAPGVGALLVHLPLLYPTGRLPSSQWRIVAWLGVLGMVLTTLPWTILPGEVGQAVRVPNPYAIEALRRWAPLLSPPVSDLIVLAAGAAAVGSLLLRFRQSRGVERQQIKWLLLAISFSLVVSVVSNYPHWFVQTLSLVGLGMVPLAIGIAILRYRLYDIEVLINRTLVYSLLTVTLALFYFVTVVLLQALFRTLTGQSSDIAIVGSTLVIATLFSPLRRRIQSLIDRRFYRRRYDAQRTLARFAASLRSDASADLDYLSADLIAVLSDTMQPSHISLWLRDS